MQTVTGVDLHARNVADTSGDFGSGGLVTYSSATTATATPSAGGSAAGSNVLTFSSNPAFPIGAVLSGSNVPSGAYVVATGTSGANFTVTMSKYPTSAVTQQVTATYSSVNDTGKSWDATTGASIVNVPGQWAGKTAMVGSLYTTILSNASNKLYIDDWKVIGTNVAPTYTASGATSTTITVDGTLKYTLGATAGEADNETFTVSGHQFTNGTPVTFTSLTGGSGLTASTVTYYIIDSDTNAGTFKVSTTVGGSAVDFTTDVTGGTITSAVWKPGQWVGHTVNTVTSGSVAITGAVTANSGNVITVSSWSSSQPANTASLTLVPTSGQAYHIATGGSPSYYIGLSSDVVAPTTQVASLAAYNSTTALDVSEYTLNGLSRKLAAYAHTSGQSTFTLTQSFTYTGTSTVTVAKIGVFNSSKAGVMSFATKLSSPVTLAQNDTINITETITIN